MTPLHQAHISALQLAVIALESITDPQRGKNEGDPTPYAIANTALTGIRKILGEAVIKHQQEAVEKMNAPKET